MKWARVGQPEAKRSTPCLQLKDGKLCLLSTVRKLDWKERWMCVVGVCECVFKSVVTSSCQIKGTGWKEMLGDIFECVFFFPSCVTFFSLINSEIWFLFLSLMAECAKDDETFSGFLLCSSEAPNLSESSSFQVHFELSNRNGKYSTFVKFWEV